MSIMNSKLHRKELLDFTEENIGTSIALYGSALRWTGDDEVTRLDALVRAFEEEHPGLEMTTQMREKVERYKNVAVGVKAPGMKDWKKLTLLMQFSHCAMDDLLVSSAGKGLCALERHVDATLGTHPNFRGHAGL